MYKKVINYAEILATNRRGLGGGIYAEIKEHIYNYAYNLNNYFQEQQHTGIFKSHAPEYYLNTLFNTYINFEINEPHNTVVLSFKLAIDTKVFALLCNMSSVLAQNGIDPLYITCLSPESLETANFDNNTYIELCALNALLHNRGLISTYKEEIENIFQLYAKANVHIEPSQLFAALFALTERR
ncbi:hypothetical protein NO1_0013 [Candidatus Termititenax aidoneus]|uniref:Uncharacterized protein n=1 Tax=Termititenax aidoneus TaxID=2218524 RepID=A0A388T6Z9_TERA1|nr:hypothetical protein NO1_0013 [Candidatus Termititenax aidoneus]